MDADLVRAASLDADFYEAGFVAVLENLDMAGGNFTSLAGGMHGSEKPVVYRADGR